MAIRFLDGEKKPSTYILNVLNEASNILCCTMAYATIPLGIKRCPCNDKESIFILSKKFSLHDWPSMCSYFVPTWLLMITNDLGVSNQFVRLTQSRFSHSKAHGDAPCIRLSEKYAIGQQQLTSRRFAEKNINGGCHPN